MPSAIPGGIPIVTIRQGTIDPKEDATDNNLVSTVSFPNFNRRPADEVK